MLVRYLKDMPICYNGRTRTEEKKGNEVEVRDELAERLILSESVEKVEQNKQEVKKQIKFYEDKQVKTYSNKKVGRPRKKAL